MLPEEDHVTENRHAWIFLNSVRIYTYIYIYIYIYWHFISKVFPSDLANSRSREICVDSLQIAVKFDKRADVICCQWIQSTLCQVPSHYLGQCYSSMRLSAILLKMLIYKSLIRVWNHYTVLSTILNDVLWSTKPFSKSLIDQETLRD